jgi:hypothetical protein
MAPTPSWSVLLATLAKCDKARSISIHDRLSGAL